MRTVPLARGDELLILHNAKLINPATIESIEVNDLACDQLAASDGQVVGIRLSERCIRGNILARLVPPTQPPPTQLPLLVTDEYPEPESPAGLPEGAEQFPDLEPETNITEDPPAAGNQ
jgi:hypothetical protein